MKKGYVLYYYEKEMERVCVISIYKNSETAKKKCEELKATKDGKFYYIQEAEIIED